MKQKLTVLVCLGCLIGFGALQSQPIPKTTLGISGGLILTGSAGGSRIEGGRNTLSGTILQGCQYFFNKSYSGGGIKPGTDDFVPEMKPGISTGINFNTKLDDEWEVGLSVGRLFGTAKGTFNGVVFFTDTTNQEYSGTINSSINGWIFELGVKRYFDASFHPFVGIGGRYSTQNFVNSIITINGKSGSAYDFKGVDEYGGYINAGLKYPISQSFFFDAEIAGIVRNGSDFDVDSPTKTISKISFEPALRLGISFDIGQYFGTERYGEDDESTPIKK
ncbi:MAG: hypothetical protein JST20_00505 [Bacteroidetes bacterium]|nr:hypothetical protein [Bacteroidota bacterium]